MAKLICGGGASRLKHELALVMAESEIVQRRVRMARGAITERAMNAAHVLRADQGQPRTHPGRSAGPDAPATAVPIHTDALRQALPQLARLERYARRAFLRGDRAARRLAPISCYELERSTDEAEVELELRDNPRDTSRSCRAAKRSQIPSHIQCCSMKPASFE